MKRPNASKKLSPLSTSSLITASYLPSAFCKHGNYHEKETVHSADISGKRRKILYQINEMNKKPFPASY